jgi:hypothetical protein
MRRHRKPTDRLRTAETRVTATPRDQVSYQRHSGGSLTTCNKSQMPMPPAPSAEDILGLARQTAAPQHADLDITVGTNVCHYSGQCLAISRPVRADRRIGPTQNGAHRRPVRRSRHHDAQTSNFPRPKPHGTRRRRTPQKPSGVRGRPTSSRSCAVRTSTPRQRRSAATFLRKRCSSTDLSIHPIGVPPSSMPTVEKILRTAQANGVTPQDWCDKHSFTRPAGGHDLASSMRAISVGRSRAEK